MSAGSEEQIEGYVDSITFRNEENGYTVFSLSSKYDIITCVGIIAIIYSGQYIVADGSFVNHPIYGEQFSITSFVTREPHSREAFLKFISSGAVAGIRKKNGTKIADRFGDDSYRIMLEEPETLAKEIKGISLSQAYEFQRILVDNKQINDAVLYLQKFGIGTNLSKKIYNRYKETLYSIVEKNPYRLAEDIKNVGFKTADDIARRMGIELDSEYRIRAALVYSLEKASEEGHTYLPMEELWEKTEKLLESHFPNLEVILTDLAVEGKVLLKQQSNGSVFVYLPAFYFLEERLAYMMVDLSKGKHTSDPDRIDTGIEKIGAETGISLDEDQVVAVHKAMTSGLLIITGGPGTGKTTIINTMIRLFIEGGKEIKLTAPTGRAAKRMSEACGYEAQTIHRLLGYGPTFAGSDKDTLHDEGKMAFEYNADNPLEADIIIVDEMSMVDLRLMNALVSAVRPSTQLILVGDEDQLPSVGAGRVLGDIMDSGAFPLVRLNKVFRQAAESDIILNAHKINKGEDVDLSKSSRDFLFIKRDNPDKIISAMYTLLTDKLPGYVDARPDEIQILTPSRVSKIGVDSLNTIMQSLINPPKSGKQEKKYKNLIFREGDKVMQIKNDYQLEWVKINGKGIRESGMGAFNGDTGIIMEINAFAEMVRVLFDDGREACYDFGDLDQLELAYAITIHKAQGSEYPAVIIPMFPVPKMLMNRKLLYTAVTRARKCVCLVGLEECFRQMENSVYELKRYSSLKDRITEAVEGAGNEYLQ